MCRRVGLFGSRKIMFISCTSKLKLDYKRDSFSCEASVASLNKVQKLLPLQDGESNDVDLFAFGGADLRGFGSGSHPGVAFSSLLEC
jgi:hypothetical protein